MSAKYGYLRADSDAAGETTEQLHRRAPEYKGYTTEDLDRVVTLLHKNSDPEKQTIRYCIDNGYLEVERDVWAGNWHASHPDYIRMMEEIPESLRRFVSSQQQRAAKVQAVNMARSIADTNGGKQGDGSGHEEAPSATTSGKSLNADDLSISSDVVSTKSEQMMNVCGTDEPISIPEALEDLRRALEVLKKANSSDEPWQHPRELLDATAGALDEAALSIRSDRSPDMGAVSEITELSKQVKKARQTLLDVSAKSVLDPTTVQEYANKVKARNATPLIVWATQTGTSKKFATELRKQLAGPDGGKYAVDIVNMKKISVKDVASRKRVYFITSTFGLGRPPRDAEFFFVSLQLQQHANDENKKTSSRPLDGVQIAVAALGNSKFGDFAAFGFALMQELQSLGARAILPVFTVNALNGRSEQRADFRQWQEEVLQLEGRTFRSGNSDIIKPGSKDFPTAGSAGNSCCNIL